MEPVYNIVKSVVAEASKQFGGKWIITDAVWMRLQVDCEILDILIKEFDCEWIQVDIDDETMEMIVCLACPDIIFEKGRSHPFFHLLQDAKAIRFSAEEDLIKVSIVFKPIFSK